MTFLSAFILCLLLNLTPLKISLLYGNEKLYISKSIILLFSTIVSIGMVVLMYAGKLIVKLFVPETANIFGAISLSFIGVYYIVEYIKMKNKNAGYDTSYYFETSLKYKKLLDSSSFIAEFNNTKNITLNNCLKFSIEFLINNTLIYISSGITGINVSLCVFVNFILSLSFLHLRYFNFSNSILNFINKYEYLTVGILLMLLGLFEAFI